MQYVLCCNCFSPNPRFSKRYVFWDILIKVMANQLQEFTWYKALYLEMNKERGVIITSMSRCSSTVFEVKGRVGFVDEGKTFLTPQTLIISGAWPPPAPSLSKYIKINTFSQVSCIYDIIYDPHCFQVTYFTIFLQREKNFNNEYLDAQCTIWSPWFQLQRTLLNFLKPMNLWMTIFVIIKNLVDGLRTR